MSRKRTTAIGAGFLGVAALLVTVPAIAWSVDGVEAQVYAEGQFLDGTVGETDLAALVALDAATASNDGTAPVAEESNPFSATVLDAITVAPGTTDIAEGAEGADVGVIGQYATAGPDGDAYASSGLVGAEGAAGVSQGEGATATIDLAALLGDAVPAAPVGLQLEASDIAAEAEASLDGYRGDSTLADLRLVLDVPSLADAQEQLSTALAPVQDAIGQLEAAGGPLASQVDALLAQAGLGGLADISVDVQADLGGVVEQLSGAVLSDPALTIDFSTGTITVDLAALPEGTDLSDMEPGTEILSEAVLTDVVEGVDRLLGEYQEEFQNRTAQAIENAVITVSANASLFQDVQTGEEVSTVTTQLTQIIDTATGQVLGTIDPGGQITSLVPGYSPTVLADLVAQADLGGLDDLLGGGAPDVTTLVTTQAEVVTEPLLSTLETSADVLVMGTLADFEAGTAVIADADAQVLGAPVDLDAAVLIGGLADAVAGGLTDPGAALDQATGGLDTGVLDPILDPLTGGGDTGEDGLAALNDLVSVQANVQELGEDGFTVTALRVELAGGDLATVDLGSATVDSSAIDPTAPGVVDPGDPGDPTAPGVVEPGDPTAGGTTGGPGSLGAEGSGSLAATGFAVGLIALLGAALLALGAWALWRSRMAANAMKAHLLAE